MSDQCSARALRAGVVCCALLAMMVACARSATAATHQVPADGDLQATLAAAQPGDTILLLPGVEYVGNYRLPLKSGDAYIVIRSAAGARELPPAGVRMTPAYTAALPKLRSPNSAPALTAEPGAHHWRIEAVEFLANAKGVGDIIQIGGGASQTQVAQMPHDLIFDRVYIHGDPLVGQKRGIAMNSGATQVINSYISDIKAIGQDSQAIAGWNGSGPYLIENNYLEAAGENVLFGGADPSVWNLVPSDITVRRNLMSKPLAWRGERWQVKNAFELKNARRVLVEGNVFEHVWLQAQNGFAILFTPRNSNGSAPWTVVEDVTFRYNTIRHAGGGVNIAGFDNTAATDQTRRIQIAHNLFYDINGDAWGGAGHLFQIGQGPRDITIEHNTADHDGNIIMAHGKQGTLPWPIEGFVFRANLMRHNKYGVIGQSLGPGRPTLDAYFPGAIVQGNVLAGGKASLYPPTNLFPVIDEFTGAFMNAGAGDFRLLPGTTFRSAGLDGGDPGVDMARLASASGAAPAGPARSIPVVPFDPFFDQDFPGRRFGPE